MSFAGITDTLNAACVGALFDAVAVVNGISKMNVIFNREYIDPFGVESSTPAMTFVEADAVVAKGDTVYVGSERFIATNVRPDGKGIVVVKLAIDNT